MTNFKLIAFNSSNISEKETLAAGRELAAQVQKGLPLDVEAFINKARVEAGWPVARRPLEKALTNPEKIKEIIAELVAPEITVPEMIKLSKKLSIMKGEVTVGLFKQVMQGYEIGGHEAEKLRALLDDPAQAESALTYVSFLDAIEFARRLSERTGRKFRIQTEQEWNRAKKRLFGNNWTWTESWVGDYYYVLHLRINNIIKKGYVAHRNADIAIRLVEDL